MGNVAGNQTTGQDGLPIRFGSGNEADRLGIDDIYATRNLERALSRSRTGTGDRDKVQRNCEDQRCLAKLQVRQIQHATGVSSTHAAEFKPTSSVC